MKLRSRFSYFFWYFIHFQVPLISKVKPKIITLDNSALVIKIPLNRMTRNHLRSMYFGTLSIGADLAGGLHAFYLAKQQNTAISLAFKSFEAQFLKRPEDDVYFVCNNGAIIQEMLNETLSSGLRINRKISVMAYTDYPAMNNLVATFSLELSLKKAV